MSKEVAHEVDEEELSSGKKGVSSRSVIWERATVGSLVAPELSSSKIALSGGRRGLNRGTSVTARNLTVSVHGVSVETESNKTRGKLPDWTLQRKIVQCFPLPHCTVWKS